MADKITLDFENNMIIWDNDAQKGSEYCPELAERKAGILAAMGYKPISFAPVIKAYEALINGQISREEAERLINEFEKNEE